MKPMIGISSAWSMETWPRYQNINIPDFYYVGSEYVNAIYELGGIPLLINPTIKKNLENNEIGNIISRIDGLLLSGGGDIGINSDDNYVPYLKNQQSQRYDFESSLIKAAWAKGLPTLGICRGHQMIAEVLGGTVTETPIPNHTDKDGVKHSNLLSILPDTLLQNIVQSKKWQVNSYHTQAVIEPPSTFVVSAISESDQVIEAIEAIDKSFFVGVQFHPERLYSQDENSSKLLSYFIHKATKN